MIPSIRHVIHKDRKRENKRKRERRKRESER